MSIEEENVTRLREAYRLWHETRAGSVDAWLNLMADEVSFCSLAEGSPGMEFTRRCRSKSDVERYFKELCLDWEILHYTVDEFIAQGDRVVALGRCGWRSRKTGKTVETPKADIIELRAGKIIGFFEFFDTAAAMAAAQA